MALNKVVDWLFGNTTDVTQYVYHRQMLVLAMEEQMGLSQAQAIMDSSPHYLKKCVLSNRDFRAEILKPIKLYKHLLGQTYDIAIYDATEDFRPSALLALAGTITYQGCLIILTPPLSQWSYKAVETPPFYLTFGFYLDKSRYINELSKKLVENEHLAIWQDQSLRLPSKKFAKREFSQETIFWSDEQKSGFHQLETFLQDEHRYAIVRAERGRGKSSLLGLYSASLLAEGKSVLVCSTAKQSVEGLLDMCHSRIQSFKTTSNQSNQINSVMQLRWAAPDSSLLMNNDYDVLIIDEAASFPAPLLLQICLANNKVILSTTTEGYEGSGKGFEHKVMRELSKSGQIKDLTLTEPLRWFKDDPLEHFLSTTLLYEDNQNNLNNAGSVANAQFVFTLSAHLSTSDLKQILHLLNDAHYQTTPDDLLRLVDSPDIYYGYLKSETGQIVAAAAVNAEGGEMLDALADDICNGVRRVKGHLSAQGIAYFAADPSLATRTYWRINRIAVKPTLQGLELGSQLTRCICREADCRQIDAVTSSFGASTSLINFWKKNGFTLLKLGLKKNKASGSGSALVATALSSDFNNLINTLSMLGYNDAVYERLETTMLQFFVTNKDHYSEINRIYFSRWSQFSKGKRNFTALSSAISWFIDQVSNGTLRSIYPTLTDVEALNLINDMQVRNKSDSDSIETLRRLMKPIFDSWNK